MARRPEVVREKVTRIAGRRFACALIFDREFLPEEIARLRSSGREGEPAASELEISGRVIRYECPEAEETRWRLAVEIVLSRAFPAAGGRPVSGERPGRPRPTAGPR
jgi:hypothetical protein